MGDLDKVKRALNSYKSAKEEALYEILELARLLEEDSIIPIDKVSLSENALLALNTAYDELSEQTEALPDEQLRSDSVDVFLGNIDRYLMNSRESLLRRFMRVESGDISCIEALEPKKREASAMLNGGEGDMEWYRSFLDAITADEPTDAIMDALYGTIPSKAYRGVMEKRYRIREMPQMDDAGAMKPLEELQAREAEIVAKKPIYHKTKKFSASAFANDVERIPMGACLLCLIAVLGIADVSHVHILMSRTFPDYTCSEADTDDLLSRLVAKGYLRVSSVKERQTYTLSDIGIMAFGKDMSRKKLSNAGKRFFRSKPIQFDNEERMLEISDLCLERMTRDFRSLPAYHLKVGSFCRTDEGFRFTLFKLVEDKGEMVDFVAVPDRRPLAPLTQAQREEDLYLMICGEEAEPPVLEEWQTPALYINSDTHFTFDGESWERLRENDEDDIVSTMDEMEETIGELELEEAMEGDTEFELEATSEEGFIGEEPIEKNTAWDAFQAAVSEEELDIQAMALALLAAEDCTDTPRFSALLCALLSANRFTDALLLSEALSGSALPREAHDLLSAALLMTQKQPMPIDEVFLTATQPAEVMQHELTLAYWRISAVLWTLFSSDTPIYLFKDYWPNIESAISDCKNNAIKHAFYLLKDFRDLSPYGFSEDVLQLTRTSEESDSARRGILQRARNLEEQSTKLKSTVPGEDTLNASLIGPKSDIGECMKSVQDGNTDTEIIRALLLEYSDEKLGITDEKIRARIDEKWISVKSKRDNSRPWRLRYASLNTLCRRIRDRLALLKEWADILEAENRYAMNIERIRTMRDKLMSELRRAMEALGAEGGTLYEKAGRAVLRQAAGDMLRILGHDRPENRFIEVLATPHIGLDEEGLPLLDRQYDAIKNYEAWRRALRHITEARLAPEEVLARVDNHKEPRWYENYGTAKALCQYLGRPFGGAPASAETRAIESHEKPFRNEMESAAANSCINESTKEELLAIASAARAEYFQRKEYARYCAFLACVREGMAIEAQTRRAMFRKKLEDICAAHGYTAAEAPIIRDIEKLIEDGKLSVAEEYINRLEGGTTEIPGDERESKIAQDYLQDFLDRYPQIYDTCNRRMNKEKTLNHWGFDYLKRAHANWESRGHMDNAQSMLGNWIVNSSSNQGKVERILRDMGFVVKGARQIPLTDFPGLVGKTEHIEVTIQPTAIGRSDYTHPISHFGTLSGETLHVLCVYGYRNALWLTDSLVAPLNPGNKTIVLIDHALSIEERRDIMRTLLTKDLLNAFLLIDRVLMLYLASTAPGRRMPALLMCSLPFTFCQPYNVNGTDVTPDEMFIGRKTELSKITSLSGVNFVYGGRRLGKTALLQRATSINHKPGEKKFAIWRDIRNKTGDEMVAVLWEELVFSQALSGENPGGISGLCNAIRRRFANGDIQELRIYLDEADAFLEDDGKNGDMAYEQFRTLKSDVSGRFNFVFAGLHNVSRGAKARMGNSAVSQSGAALCIRPLAPHEARTLVEIPLGFLGYRMKEEIDQILSITNYYPGTLHLFCSTLILDVAQNFQTYYPGNKNAPPYPLDDERMKRILGSAAINDSITGNLIKSIELDSRYETVAYLMVYDNIGANSEGVWLKSYTLRELRDIARQDIGSHCLRNIKDEDLENIMDEMTEMGILWQSEAQGKKRYRLRKYDYLERLNNDGRIEKALLGGEDADA